MIKILVTGGAGFIGSAVVRLLLAQGNFSILCLDKLTYAGNLESIPNVDETDDFSFERVDICDSVSLSRCINDFRPQYIMHLAAESHVDRSIDAPADFIDTNIYGTFALLEQSRKYFRGLSQADKSKFRFHHISTDEVFGDLGSTTELFTESSSYAPSSPYSASKAASDHLVRAWGRTFDLPVIITNCSNNYGPYQFPEKLIPHVILNALKGLPLPLYGDGTQIRDWLYVDDHARALLEVIINGKVGETYNIGGHNEMTNLEVVELICDLLEEFVPVKPSGISKYRDQIVYVKDRPGHDLRYAVDASKIQRDLGWVPDESFNSGLRKTVLWYVENDTWLSRVQSGEYQEDRSNEC